MRSERKANDYLAQTAEAFQAEREVWEKKLALAKKQPQRVTAPAKVNFFAFFFKMA